MRKNLLLFIFSALFTSLSAQTTLVAELTGNPLNTYGWVPVSNTNNGHTGGVASGDHFILTEDFTGQRGAIYYDTPFNLNQCNSWKVEFDFLVDGQGTTAYGHGDGLAFWYLENPPTNFISGAGLGIPSTGKGIIVGLDTFDNATENQQSEVQVLYGQGYSETANAAQMSFFNTIPMGVHIRNTNYQHAIIQWNNGNITINIAGVEICNFAPTPYSDVEDLTSGYFGFSASTGGTSDNHFIKNVQVYYDAITLNSTEESLYACESGTTAGISTFDLTSVQENITSVGNVTYWTNLEDAESGTGEQITTPSSFTNTTAFNQTVYVRVQNGTCYSIAEIHLSVGIDGIIGTSATITLVDSNADETENFNLPTALSQLVTTGTTGLTYTYYPTYDNAQNQTSPIETPTAYPSSGSTVYVRIENEGGCFRILPILLKLTTDNNLCSTALPICPYEGFGLNVFSPRGESTSDVGPYYGCLGAQPGPRWFYMKIDQPGTIVFDLNQYDGLNQTGQGRDIDFIVWGPFDEPTCGTALSQSKVVDCSFSGDYVETITIGPNAYNPSAQPAIAGKYYMLLITNYYGLYHPEWPGGYFNLIYNETLSTGTFDCSILNLGETYLKCDLDGNGEETFDLNSEITPDVTDGNTSYTVKYYNNVDLAQEDSENGIVSSPYTVNIVNSPVTLYAQIKDPSGAILNVVEFYLKVGTNPVANNYSVTLCDVSNDGTETVDLTSYIPNMSSDISGISISYYASQSDAELAQNQIANTTTYEATNNGIVYVRFENTSGCYVVNTITFELLTLEVSLPEDFTMCEGTFPVTTTVDTTGYTGVTYTWTHNGEVQSETSNTFNIVTTGTYTVTVNTTEGCSGSDTIVVSDGPAPTISMISVGPDYAIITATSEAGGLQYSLTGTSWQTINQFNTLPAGNYTLYVKDADGCIATTEFVIFNIPTMFTPNGDGINDTWNIKGMDVYPGSTVQIYDRYSRLAKEGAINGNVIWDGYYSNGQKAPSQDYWYIIKVTDGRQFTGHITLKSRGPKE